MNDDAREPGVEIIDEVDLVQAHEPLDEVAYRLWRKAVRFGTWDPAAIDLQADRAHYLALERPLQLYLERFLAAFYNAEENVARVFTPWIVAGGTVWQQAYLSTHLVEEFKHVDFFQRYFQEVLRKERGPALANPVHDTLVERGRRLMESLERDDPATQTLRRVEAVTHYMAIIEGIQATAGYRIFLDVFAKKGLLPGLAEGFRNIQRDEGRHVSFGLQVLRHFAHRDARYAERIQAMFAEYLPLIRQRYGQTIVDGDAQYPPPAEERGLERVMELYHRRLADIFPEGKVA